MTQLVRRHCSLYIPLRQEFYTVHGNDALYVAQNFYHTTGVLKWFGKGFKNGK
jgi:hypothetical protein